MKRRGKRILRMEDAGTSEKEGTDSQDSNVPLDHGHLARNYLIKKITNLNELSVELTLHVHSWQVPLLMTRLAPLLIFLLLK